MFHLQARDFLALMDLRKIRYHGRKGLYRYLNTSFRTSQVLTLAKSGPKSSHVTFQAREKSTAAPGGNQR